MITSQYFMFSLYSYVILHSFYSAVQTVSEMSLAGGSGAPALVIVDSVQTMRSASSASAAGSVTQIRDSTAQLVQLAKLTGWVNFVCVVPEFNLPIFGLFLLSIFSFVQEALF